MKVYISKCKEFHNDYDYVQRVLTQNSDLTQVYSMKEAEVCLVLVGMYLTYGYKTQIEDEIRTMTDKLLVHIKRRSYKKKENLIKHRSTVQKAIQRGIQKIKCVIPDLGHHLTEDIKTGNNCVYRPAISLGWSIILPF